jgi:hypothetical protein
MDTDNDPVKCSSTEPYSRVAADLDWSILLGAASSIFFSFLLNTAVNSPSYFQILDNIVLLAALYAVTVATVMFMMPVIYHSTRYRQFDVDRFLSGTKEYVLIGTIWIILGKYLSLGLALNSKLPVQIAYSLASLPAVFVFFQFFRHGHE